MFAIVCRLVLLAVTAASLVACQTPGGAGTAPIAPGVGPLTVNASIWVNEPLTAYFANHGTQAESAGTVAMNDLYFANPFAFQVQLQYQLAATGFEIRENGVAIPLLQARTNTKSRPSKVAPADVIDPATGQVITRAGTVTEWDWPLPATMLPRGVLPTDKSSYSIELINTCGNRLNPAAVSCANPDAIILLTISPTIRPNNPTHGQVFTYTLIENGSGNFSGSSAKSILNAIFIEQNKCQIRSLILQPTVGKAETLETASFEATDCRRVQLKVSSEQNALFDRVAPTFADNVIDSRGFVLPKVLSVTATLTAHDSMQRAVTRTARVDIDACSISATHPQCPANCTANPSDARCPANCTVTPGDPRCASACPRTTDNPSGAEKAWNTGMYCGTFQTIPVTIYGCSFAAASQAYPPQFGCSYTTITGTPVGSCPSGSPVQNFDLCLSCTPAGGGAVTRETAIAQDVCTLDIAKQSAIDARQPRACTFVSAGRCP